MNTKKRLLLAGGGYADIPLIAAAKKLGYYVITSGNRSEDLGHKYSDEYCPADFSDPEAVLAVAERNHVSAVCACCNDFSALSAAYVAEKMCLPGHDPYKISEIIHHKDQYRKFALENDIPTPKAAGFSHPRDAVAGVGHLAYPLIIKPVDLTGGKGIAVVDAEGELESAVVNAFAVSKAKRIVIEEFISGTRHGMSAFLVNGKVVFRFVDNEHYHLNPYLVSAASAPGIVPDEAIQDLCLQSEKIAGLLSLETGIFHIQFILKGGKPFIIEICRRAPGDLYISLVKHATGVDYPEWIVRASAGLDCDGLKHAEPHGFFTRHCVMGSNPGIVKDIVFDKSIKPHIVDKFMWGKPGDSIDNILTSKFGIVFLEFSSQTEMIEKTEQMQQLIRVETE